MLHPKPIERRLSSRRKVELPVDLVLADGIILAVTVDTISRHGMQFSCTNLVASTIDPHGIHHHSLEHISLRAVAELDDCGKLYVDCRVVAARRLSQDSYVIGLEFIDFQNGCETRLETYREAS